MAQLSAKSGAWPQGHDWVMNEVANMMQDVANVQDSNTVATEAHVVNEPRVVDAPATKRVLKATQPPKMSHTKKPSVTQSEVAIRQPIPDGEPASTEFRLIDDRRAEVKYTFRLNKDSKERYSITTVLDYSDCSVAEILEFASRTNVITLQRNLRGMGTGALKADVYQKVNVKVDLVEAQRSAMDGETRDIHAFARATRMPVERARILLARIIAEENGQK
jgi:hypothetical protein